MDLPIQTMKILKNSEYFNDVFSKCCGLMWTQ